MRHIASSNTGTRWRTRAIGTALSATLLATFLCLCAAGAGAQIYKWVDAKGRVHYSDTAPTGPTKVKELPFAGADSGAVLPYELAQASKAFPVTLYTTSNCVPCDLGRTLLRTRGIPHTEKSVTTPEDLAAFKRINSGGQFPLLRVGRKELPGFEEGAWNMALSNALYPIERILPPNYQFRSAEALAPPPPSPPPATAPAKTTAPAALPRAAPAPQNAVPGFRF